jgi:predicted ABC-type transport system involved in lysophospholipase L1 biosynthesis ATPase subunit
MSRSSDGRLLLRLDRIARGSLRPVSFSLAAGETIKIIAESRDMADELIGILGGQFLPTAGRLEIFGEEAAFLSEAARLALHARLGLVPEHGGLISNLKAWENLILPATFHHDVAPDELEGKVSALARRLGIAPDALAAMLGKLPDRLTMVERRQVALMRAALMKPSLYIYDHLHAGLDRAAGEAMLKATTAASETADGTVYLCPDDAVSARITADRTVRLGAEGT